MNAFKFHAPYMYSEKIEWFKVTFLKIEWCNTPLELPPTGALLKVIEYHYFNPYVCISSTSEENFTE